MKGKRVLIDTSVWIDYLKGNDKQLAERVDDILTFADVFVPKIIIAELIQGSRSEAEIATIDKFIKAFNIIDQTEVSWLKAGKLSYMMKKKGTTVNLVDCYIAVIAEENNCTVFSLDQHFKSIRKFINIELIS